jgi:hypothetical protein
MMNIEQIREKLQGRFDDVLKQQMEVDIVDTELVEAMKSDTHLMMFVMCAVDFLQCNPVASMAGEFEVAEDGSSITLQIPIAHLFQGYTEMWMKAFFEGQPITGEQSIIVTTEEKTSELG